MARVWERSAAKGSALLLLLAIADHAHDDGTGAWPSQAMLAAKTRLSVRQVRRLTVTLEGAGELRVEKREGTTDLLTVLVQETPDNLSDPAGESAAPDVRPTPDIAVSDHPGHGRPTTPDIAVSDEPSSNRPLTVLQTTSPEGHAPAARCLSLEERRGARRDSSPPSDLARCACRHVRAEHDARRCHGPGCECSAFAVAA